MISREPRVRDLYSKQPADLSAFREHAGLLLRRDRPWNALAEAFARSTKRYDGSSRRTSRLNQLAEGQAVMLVTGQQVGYLGGPFYTFLKAYHATRLASELEHALGIPVLPVFWLEGEDHDLAEVRAAVFATASGELKTLSFEPSQEIRGREVGFYRVDAAQHITDLEQSLESADAEGLKILREAYTDTTLSDGMGRLLDRTLGPRGLFVVEGMDEGLKRLASSLWSQIIARGEQLGRMLGERSAELRRKGWDTPLTPTQDSYLFYYVDDDHVRCPVTYSGMVKHPDGHSWNLSADDLNQIAAEEPHRISPKAALRPLYQDYVLPTIAYIAGPGEMDYHAQLTPFYSDLGVEQPVILPRLSATILDPRAARAVEKCGVPLARLLSEDQTALRKEVLRESDTSHTAELFEQSRAQIEQVFAELKSALQGIDPTLAGAAHSAAGKALFPIQDLQQKTDRALKQKHATTLARLDKALTAVRPKDRLAERLLCTGYYLALFGVERLLNALDQLPLDDAHHHLITLE